MSTQGPPPPTTGERLSAWWKRRRTISKVAIVISGIWLATCTISMVAGTVGSPDPAPEPTVTRTGPQQTQSAYDLELYRSTARLACKYARAANFDHELASKLVQYDYG